MILGITKDTSEGYRWASLSAKQGYAPAENLLGDSHLKGTGVEKDFKSSFKMVFTCCK